MGDERGAAVYEFLCSFQQELCAALAELGLPTAGQLPAADRVRVVAVLAKAEAGSTGAPTMRAE